MANSLLTPETAERFAGLELKSAGDYRVGPDAGSFIVLYGQGGAGKTTLAANACEIEPWKKGDPPNTFVLDAEGGADAISHLGDRVKVAEMYEYNQFKLVCDLVAQGKAPWKNLAFDNMSEVVNRCLASIAGNTDAPEIQEWGKMTREILYRTRQLRDAARKYGYNIFMLAWDADEKDDRGVLKKDLAFTPALRKEFPGIVTIVGHVRVLDNPNQRMLDFAPGPRTVSKFRRSADSAATKIPFQITYGLDKLPMADVLKTMKGGQDWPESKYAVAPRNAQPKQDS